MTDYENLVVSREGPVATVTINRPRALNALSSAVVGELIMVTAELEMDPAVRAVILTGAGDRAFVAGADIGEMSSIGVREARAFAESGWQLTSGIEESDRPWIAAVNGFALGGGCEIALACDFIYASKSAKLGQPEVNLGVIPGFGGTQRLLRRVGIAKARELVYTGDMVTAEEALRIGLVDAVVEPGELLVRARQTAEKIASKGPLAVAAAKRAMQLGQGVPLAEACALEAQEFAMLFETADQKEGMKAFLEKRQAQFEGR